MTDKYILNDHGQPVLENDVVAWGKWFASSPRHVGLDQIRDVSVSTVFLGLDHRFGGHGMPILWETIVFGGPLDGEGQRYSSKEAAVAGHADYVARVSASPKLQDDTAHHVAGNHGIGVGETVGSLHPVAPTGEQQ